MLIFLVTSLDFTSNMGSVLGYDSVVVLFDFFPQVWDESCFVSLVFMAFEKVMLAFESEVIEKIPLV